LLDHVDSQSSVLYGERTELGEIFDEGRECAVKWSKVISKPDSQVLEVGHIADDLGEEAPDVLGSDDGWQTDLKVADCVIHEDCALVEDVGLRPD
jgi:hypothetical protein